MTTDDEMRRLAEAATPGPWCTWFEPDDVTSAGVCTDNGLLEIAEESMRPADADFIAAAREKMPDLLDRVAKAEATIDRVRNVLGRGYGHIGNLTEALTKALDEEATTS